jgi:hypothetical protein
MHFLKNIRSSEPTYQDERIGSSWQKERQRLYLLRGLPCPLCTQQKRHIALPVPAAMGRPAKKSRRFRTPTLSWTGVSLVCCQGHGWSNPEVLNAELHQCGQDEV